VVIEIVQACLHSARNPTPFFSYRNEPDVFAWGLELGSHQAADVGHDRDGPEV